MKREAARTLYTLSSHYQRNVEADDYEVIVVDNGSTDGFDGDAVSAFGDQFRFFSMPAPTCSPAPALNFGARQARGNIIVSMIDGARMVSPGCLSGALQAFDKFPNAAVIVPSWHLGPEVQNESVKRGYNQRIEDELLDSADWRSDGYHLFGLCESLDPSSRGIAWFGSVAESNFIAVKRETYDRLGGFDERFNSAGGGAVSLDFFRRVCEDAECQVVSLIGEGTFHQFHGGVSTNVPTEEHPWTTIHDQYRAIRNKDFVEPAYVPIIFGDLGPQALRWLSRKNPALFKRLPAPGRDNIWPNIAPRSTRARLASLFAALSRAARKNAHAAACGLAKRGVVLLHGIVK